MAQEHIRSHECSYKILGSTLKKATATATLLEKDSFHFGRINTVSLQGNSETWLPECSLLMLQQGATDTAAPYKHQEMLLVLSHFFKGNDFMRYQLPTRDYSHQIPKSMVALMATTVGATLVLTFVLQPKY